MSDNSGIRAVVIYPPEPLATIVDDFRRVHDPESARAIRAHVTVAHRMTSEHESRLPSTRGTGAFRLGIDGLVTLGFAPTVHGTGLRIVDLDGGLARVSAAIGIPMSTLPHLTLLYPGHSTGPEQQRDVNKAAARLRLPREFVATELAFSEERDDAWFDLERFVL